MADELAGMVGCGDNSCVIAKPTGMGTNGGCRCPDWKLRGAVSYLRRTSGRIKNTLANALPYLEHRSGCAFTIMGSDHCTCGYEAVHRSALELVGPVAARDADQASTETPNG